MRWLPGTWTFTVVLGIWFVILEGSDGSSAMEAEG